jgi:hypothetical protein
MFLSPDIAHAYDPAFAWDANTEPDLAGYYIYYKTGASGAPYNGTGADEGNSPIRIPKASLSDPANPQYAIHGLSDTETYFFVITAYDIYNNESSYSNELGDPQPQGFTDLPPGYWAEDAIYKIYNAGITQGCSQEPLLYCPDDSLTGAQIAVFLLRVKHGAGYAPPPATGIFDDVPLNYWAADWIEQLFHEGITQGCSQEPLLYCPDDSVTRTRMAIFLLRVKHGAGYTPPPATGIFDDVPLSHWAADWIEQMFHEGFTIGCGTNPLRYCPDEYVTRAQMAVFLDRAFGL